MKAPKGYKFRYCIDYDDRVEYIFENVLGDIKIYVEYKKEVMLSERWNERTNCIYISC